MPRHSPQKVGIESRRDRTGTERHRGVVYDKGAHRPIRGPWEPTLAAARSWRVDALDRLAKGTLSGDRGATVGETIDVFLAGIDDGSVLTRSGRPYKPSVRRDYRRDLDGRMRPLVGAVRLRELRLTDVQRAADKLARDGLSASTVRNTVMALRAMYRWARPRGLCFHQPCEGVELGSTEQRRMRVATAATAALMVGALSGRDRTAFALACYAGLRAGELLALDWTHIDTDLRVLRVERGWDHGTRQFIAPKSRAAERVVPVTERLHVCLVDHAETFGTIGLVLPSMGPDQAVPMSHSALTKRMARRWRAAGLEPLRLHEGRHTFASLLIAAGANAKAITTYMGHSSIQVTFDRYGHLMPGSEAEVAGLLDSYLGASAA